MADRIRPRRAARCPPGWALGVAPPDCGEPIRSAPASRTGVTPAWNARPFKNIKENPRMTVQAEFWQLITRCSRSSASFSPLEAAAVADRPSPE
jgi:hypothetical protein